MSTFSIPKVNISLSIIIFLVFFLGNNVLSAYNIPHQLYTLSIVLLCLINLIPSFHKKIHKNGSLRNLLFFLTIYWAWKVFNGGEGSIMIGIIVFLPPYIYLCFINSRQQPFFYKKILYLAYIIECSIAIIERLFISHVFKYEKIGIQAPIGDFRSIGLYGHPLQNALIVLIFVNFILIYENDNKKKYIMAFFGLIAIFCFNARAAIVISISSVFIYFFHWLIINKASALTKFLYGMLFILSILLTYFLYQKGLLGGRLFSMGLYDEESSGVRLQVWEIFKYYSPLDFLTGIGHEQLQILKMKMELFAIENFWLYWMFSYGLIFVIGIVLFYIPVLNDIFKNERLFNKLFLIVPFFVLASTNPSLSSSFVPMTSFLLLSLIMKQTSKMEKLYGKNFNYYSYL